MLHVYNEGEVSWSKSPQQTLWALQGEPWPIDATLISKHMLAQTYLLNQLWYPLYKMEIFFMQFVQAYSLWVLDEAMAMN